MSWLFLLGSIVFEVGGTLCLRLAARRRIWYLPVAVGYAVAFGLLSVTLRAGMPLGVAYGIWSAVGVALTAVLSRVLFGERFGVLTAVGVVLIMGGVLLVETGSAL